MKRLQVLFIVLSFSQIVCAKVLCSDGLSFSAEEKAQGKLLLQDYARSKYKWINEMIRKNPRSPESERFIRLLSAALSDIPPVQGTVYRGIGSDLLPWVDSLKEGEEFVWDTPTSASLEKSIAHAFGPLVFTIQSKSAKPVKDYAIYAGVSGPNEREVVFKPRTRFRFLHTTIPYPGFINREVFIEEIE